MKSDISLFTVFTVEIWACILVSYAVIRGITLARLIMRLVFAGDTPIEAFLRLLRNQQLPDGVSYC